MIQVILTYLVNVFIILLFFPILEMVVQLVYPFSWQPLMDLFHIQKRGDIAFYIAGILPIVVALLYLSPPGRWILHFINGERKPSDGELTIVNPLMDELCARSDVGRNSLVVRMKTDDEITAFATGFNHITITTGALLAFEQRQLLGVLAHELGHLQHRDTIYILINHAMNLVGKIVLQLVIVLHNLLNIFMIIPILNLIVRIFQFILQIMIRAVQYILQIPMWITYYFDSRRREYAADRYAVDIGLGRELRAALTNLGLKYGQLSMLPNGNLVDGESRGWWSGLFVTHPKTINRINCLSEAIELYELKHRLKQSR